MAVRALYTKGLLEKRQKRYEIAQPYSEVMGAPGQTGMWLIYGAEKNGKTWFSVKLAEFMSAYNKVLYVSAEEGMEETFQETIKRAQIDPNNRRVKFLGYTPIDDLDSYLSKRQAPKIIFIDNVTVYTDELKNGRLRKFTRDHKDKLFVFIAHEEGNVPYTPTAKMVKRLAKIIMRVVGLKVFVSGRCPGGELVIDEAKSRLYHGVTN